MSNGCGSWGQTARVRLGFDGGSEKAHLRYGRCCRLHLPSLGCGSLFPPCGALLLMLRPLVPNAGHLEEHASTLWRDFVGQFQALARELSIQLSTRHPLWSPPLATQPANGRICSHLCWD
jgi:hypothetical protein